MNDKITNPDEAAAWAKPYGGIDRVEGPDVNGTMTYYARDGSYVNVRPDGSFASRGFNPASGGAGSPTASAPAMTPAQAQAIYEGGNGVPASASQPSAPAPSTPADATPSAPAALTGMSQDELGAYLQQIAPGGDVKNLRFEHGVNQKTVTTVTGRQQVSVPFVRWIDAAGKRVYEYDVNPDGSYTNAKPTVPPPPSSATRTPAEQAADAKAVQDQKEREANNDPNIPDPAYETNAERRARAEARIKQQGIDANTAHDNAVADQTRAQAAAAAERVAQASNRVVVNGQLLEKQPDGTWKPVTAKAGEVIKGGGRNGEDVQSIVGTDGKITYQPIEGAKIPEQGAGPPMPQFVVGHSQEALRTYQQQLAQEVASGRHTQAWADARWGEAVTTANAVINEAATAQREAESTRNSESNLAQSRLSAATSGFNAALQFAQNLKTGDSTTGGAAFGALMTLQLAQAQRMGAYPSSLDQRPQSSEGRSIADASPAATSAFDQTVARATATPSPQSVSPTVAPAALAAPSSPAPAPMPSTPAAVAAAAAPPPPPPADMRNSSDMDLPPGTPTAPPAANYAPGAGTIPLPQGTDLSTPGTDVPFNDPANPTPGLPVGQAPGSDWSVMAKAMPQTAPPPAPAPAPAFTPDAMPYAMLHSAAAATPWWQMTPEEEARYRAAGVPESVIRGGTPGIAA